MTVRSLAAADSGITTMQTMIDTIGNNLANSNTNGYKQTTAQFEDVLTEQLTPASAPTPGLSSTNPSAIGAGAQVSAIETDWSQGATVQTGSPTDAAIQGNGFFVVSQGGQTYYTRDGNFQLDANGTLSTANGGIVQGWGPNQPTTGPTTSLTIPSSLVIPPSETTKVTLGGNLPSGSTQPITTTTTIFDAQGDEVPVDLTFTPGTGANAGTWTMKATVNGTDLFTTDPTVTFGPDGQVKSDTGGTTASDGEIDFTTSTVPTGYQWNETSLTFAFPAAGSSSAVTQYASAQSIEVADQDGYTSGSLESYAIGQTGEITGTFSNGQSEQLGTIALAQFSNPGGLSDLGNLSYQPTAASGQAQVGTAGNNGLGTLLGGALEQSNVDLGGQLTALIEAQTAYQADTKVVSTTQTVLQSLVTNA
ncbi:MAG TPA: flagellar hook protein FlgE [Acidimicrobiales bacterium]|nr:flagellar hook protein FlgE [Acidimicrobiales bacterium]